jgi:diguanylate cyclase (GGDEF)-like protein
MRHARTLSIPIAIVCTLAMSIMYLADTYLHHALDMTIARDAENRATNWSRELLARTPVTELLASNHSDDASLLDRLSTSAEKNGFVHIKLYSPKGSLLLDLDDPSFQPDPIPQDIDNVARDVFNSGEIDTTLFQEHGNPTSQTFVETYLPAIGPDGQAFGVIRVSVDATSMSNSLHHVFHRLSRLLIFGSAVVYLIPSLVLIFKAEQLRAKDRVLLDLSMVDSLTGLLNRRAFNDRSAEVFRRRKFAPIGVLFFDVDRFKAVNDDLGHDFGDALLRHVATSIRSVTRPEDLVGRIGGDEFMVVSSPATREGLLDLGVSIQAAMDKPFSHNGTTILPSLSIGAHLSLPVETREKAIHAADLATYRAKANGRAQLVLYDPEMGVAQTRRRYVEATLRKAMTEDQGFFVEYQPIFGAGGHAVRGFEALLRLRDGKGELISPAEFIPIAEESGLIVDIGRKTLATVLRAAKAWPAHLFVSVNLSAVQFKDGNIVDIVRHELRQAEFDPARLEFEVTESLLLEYENRVTEQLSGLKALGVAISLDDFGTGYSSLGYLWQYEFDKLKIDRVFLQGFDLASEKYRKVIGTIVMLGRNLGMEVTVEGIEGAHQLSMLTEMGCDQFQGYLLGRPMSEAAAGALAQPTGAERAAG